MKKHTITDKKIGLLPRAAEKMENKQWQDAVTSQKELNGVKTGSCWGFFQSAYKAGDQVFRQLFYDLSDTNRMTMAIEMPGTRKFLFWFYGN